MIDIKTLTKKDVQQKVEYRVSPESIPEIGVITGWSLRYIFVSFNNQMNSQACYPAKLQRIFETETP